MTDRTSHRSIIERWVIQGRLILETPAHFGNGDADPLTDMPLLVDEVEGDPLLPGTSIAGALRNYLREREYGYGKAEAKGSKTALLFGSSRVDEDGKQSPLVIDDARGTSAGFELRDGVAIDPETRTAADEKKFDMQLLAAGSAFDLRFELIVSKDSQQLRDALFTALTGLEKGEITLGARKRRGFGQVTVKDWQVFKFDLTTKNGLINWLGFEQGLKTPKEQPGADLAAKLGATLQTDDKRSSAHLTAHFAIDGTLLIRSGFGETGNSPDTVHIRSARPGHEKPIPIIPGTSLAGVLRQRALKIARTIAPDNDKKIAQGFVDSMFGPSEIKPDEKHAKASRVSIKETEIKDSTQLVVTRVKIDRFTGGAYESALFSEQPEIGKPNTKSVTLDLTLRDSQDAELGLLLLLLKDLWTGDLPIGGESSVGRGRLNGIGATLDAPATKEIHQKSTWTFKADGENVQVEEVNNLNADELEKWVKAFNDEIRKAQVNHE
jgi:CRISPR/Cas system CSM-associated protein Csm3 (group 7 of RAMP superfamily)